MTEINQEWLNSQKWSDDVENALHRICQRSWFRYSLWLKISPDVIEHGMKQDSDRAAWTSFVCLCKQRDISVKNFVENAMLPSGDRHIVIKLQEMLTTAPIPPAPTSKPGGV